MANQLGEVKCLIYQAKEQIREAIADLANAPKSGSRSHLRAALDISLYQVESMLSYSSPIFIRENLAPEVDQLEARFGDVTTLSSDEANLIESIREKHIVNVISKLKLALNHLN